MFARFLLGGALAVALVTFSAGANAESNGNGRVWTIPRAIALAAASMRIVIQPAAALVDARGKI